VRENRETQPAPVFLFLVVLTVVATASTPRVANPPPDSQSNTGPAPLAGIESPEEQRGPSPLAVVIPGVPPYLWRHGCGPTAAGMVLGYWDGHGYPQLVAGDAASQTSAVDQMIATGNGAATNYADYCQPIDSPPTLLADKSSTPPGDEHADDSLADFMLTSRSAQGNYYGWSWFSNVDDALRDQVAWAGDGLYTGTTSNLYWGSSLTWESLRGEIDAGRPMVFLVDSDGNGGTDHFVTAVGYDDSEGTQRYACLDTWFTSVRWADFAGMQSGHPWGIYGGVTLQLSAEYPLFLPLILRNEP